MAVISGLVNTLETQNDGKIIRLSISQIMQLINADNDIIISKLSNVDLDEVAAASESVLSVLTTIQGLASQVSIDATNSDSSANAAATSETNALNSANAAETSETNALNSANAAAISETNALNSANAAETSETNALNSANAAATSETNALNSANAAETSETNAYTSETNAYTSETNALASANAAAASLAALGDAETNALASANAAAISETNALNSANAAATSETNALNSANAAELAEDNSAISAASALSSKTSAETAKTQTQSIHDAAVLAMAGTTNLTEINDARRGQASLGQKIDLIDSQLAEKASNTALNVEKARITNLATLTAGSTTGDAELIDARVDASGYIFPTCGENIRNIYRLWKNGISNVVLPDWVQGNIDASGADATATDKIRTGYHQFTNGETITFSINPAYLYVYKYNSSKVFESMIINTVKNGSFIADGNCFYRFKIWNGAILTPSYSSNLVLSTTETPAPIAKINNDIKLIKGDAVLNVPSEYFIIKGKPMELFKYGMFFTKNPYLENEYIVRINNIDSYVTVYSDRFKITIPTNYANATLSANVVLYDKNNIALETKSIVFRVVDATAITASNASKKIAFFGDSLIASEELTLEVANMLKNTYGLTNTALVGKYTDAENQDNKYTANGGYAWDNYLYNPSTLPISCPNNWLWSTSTGDISFTEFMTNFGSGASLDYVVCLLGWNDFESSVWASNYSIANLEAKIRLFLTKMHTQYPNCKAILMSYHMAYPRFNISHSNNLPYTRNKFIYDLTVLYNKLSSELSYVKFVHTSSQFDVFNNLKMTTVNANLRNTTQIAHCQDTVHPATSGYNQYADNVTSALLYLMQD